MLAGDGVRRVMHVDGVPARGCGSDVSLVQTGERAMQAGSGWSPGVVVVVGAMLGSMLGCAAARASGQPESASALERQARAEPLAEPQGEQPGQAPKTPDSRGEHLLTALRAGDLQGATSHFDARMRSALPPERLGSVWSQLGSQVGELRSWMLTERTHRDGREIRVYRLDFSRGVLRGVVSVDPGTLEVTGLRFIP